MSEPDPIPSGVWEHFKGRHYLVLGLGRFDEDDGDVVVYVRIYERPEGGHPISVRRASDFLTPVEWPDGETAPRFRLIGADAAS